MEKTILIADDEMDFVATLRARLEFEGFGVATAGDGVEALQKATTEKPDLVLLDIMMPTMNGFQVCRELRNNPETQFIRVVMLTAKSQESDRFWGKEAGADDYITKPFDMDQLLGKIRAMLEG